MNSRPPERIGVLNTHCYGETNTGMAVFKEPVKVLGKVFSPRTSDQLIDVFCPFAQGTKCIASGTTPEDSPTCRIATLLSKGEYSDEGLSLLKPRHREVLTGVAMGKTNVEIGTVLFIENHTVKGYLDQSSNRLGVSARENAAVVALRRGFLPTGLIAQAVDLEPYKSLPEQQKSVLRAAAEHETNEQIAQALAISPGTVKTHLQRIRQKTKRGRMGAHAVAMAIVDGTAS